MKAFFDTSALVPLLLKEPRSGDARVAWERATERMAWQWLRVEAEAALVRRTAPSAAWRTWRLMESAINWIEPAAAWLDHLRTFNRSIGLQAADAGHLYVMERCCLAGVPDLVLVTFDREMIEAGAARGLVIWKV